MLLRGIGGLVETRTGAFEEHSRGRYKSRLNLYGAPLKSIILISKKYELDPKLLVSALAKAWKNKTPVTEADLAICCRDIDHDSVTFLITKGEKVVSQFPMKAEVLRDPEFFERLTQSLPEPEFEPHESGFPSLPQKFPNEWSPRNQTNQRF